MYKIPEYNPNKLNESKSQAIIDEYLNNGKTTRVAREQKEKQSNFSSKLKNLVPAEKQSRTSNTPKSRKSSNIPSRLNNLLKSRMQPVESKVRSTPVEDKVTYEPTEDKVRNQSIDMLTPNSSLVDIINAVNYLLSLEVTDEIEEQNEDEEYEDD